MRSSVVGWAASLPLYWRVFATNAAVLVAATAALALAPVTVSSPVASKELVVLLVGLAAMLALTALLLRAPLAPLDELAETMHRVDPLAPGERVHLHRGDPMVLGLAQAFNDMLERLETERRESARRALAVQEGERRRIARELHDEVGQLMTAMLLQVESIALHAPAELTGELEELRATARAGAEDVRDIARRLRPEALDELGLQSALVALSAAVADQAGLDVRRRLDTDLPLDEEQELVIYRVAQEALTNVVRHAHASRVEVALTRRDGEVELAVRDDGRGLPPAAAGSSTGILGMRERAMLIAARLDIGPRPAGGTEVVLRVPAAGSPR